MKDLNIGIIGCGKMGKALFTGLIDSGFENVFAYDTHSDLVPEGKFKPLNDLVANSQLLILAVKPFMISQLINEISTLSNHKKIICSIAAGISISQLEQACNHKHSCVRIMPNLPASVGKGVFGISFSEKNTTDTTKTLVNTLFSSIGKTFILPEEKMEAFTGVVGCGPAFIFLFMEGFYQAAVNLGFSHDLAKSLTTATFEGTVALAEASPLSYHDLRQQVCSPKGVTIKGVNHLERTATRANITDAILIASNENELL